MPSFTPSTVIVHGIRSEALYFSGFPLANNRPPRFINGEFVKGADGKTFESINPSTEKPIVAVHEATEKDVDIAVSAARKAFEGEWKTVTPEQRGRLLVKLGDLFEQNLDLLAAIEALDNGKAFNIAKIDIGMCASTLRYYGGWADKIEGKVVDTNAETFSYTKQEPVSHAPPLVYEHRSDKSYRLASAGRSSHGTFPFSCGPGRSVPS